VKAFGSVFLFLLAVGGLAFIYLTPQGKALLSRKERVVILGEDNPEFDTLVTETNASPAGGTSASEPLAAAPATENVQPAAGSEDASFFGGDNAAAAATATPRPAAGEQAAPKSTKPIAALTLEEVVRQPKVWPNYVTLKKDYNFPLVMDGRTIGSAKVTAGSRVKVIAVHLEAMVVDFNGNRINVPADDTDLLAQVNKATGEDQTIIASQGQ
jgi:hypothetical protein